MDSSGAEGAGVPLLASVVVPVLNGARFLDRALGSLARQTWPSVETIVVDGGSTDASLDIVRGWSQRIPLRLISEPDRGQAEAINKGLSLARGEIVGWLNADDMLEPRAIETAAVRFRRDPNLRFTWGFCLVIDAEDAPLYVQNPFARTDLQQLRWHRNFVPQPGSWFRASVIQEFGLLDESFHYMFDYEYFLRLAGRVRAVFVPEIVARFRIHDSSKTSRAHAQFLREEQLAYRLHGGPWFSPFYLDLYRYKYVETPLQIVKRPLRTLLWRVFRLPAGARLRA